MVKSLLWCLVAVVFSLSVDADDSVTVKIVMGYTSQDGCSFMYSPVNFCEKRHFEYYSKALGYKPNFFKDFVVVPFLEWPDYHQRSLVVVNKLTGEVHPVPIDAYFLSVGRKYKDGRLEFSLNSDRLCVVGDILVYRSVKNGRFCFVWDGERFSGYKTAYME